MVRLLKSKLIRRMLLVSLLMIVPWLVCVAIYKSGKPAGTIDYAAQFNQPIDAIAEDQRAWLVYRDVWTKYKLCSGSNDFMPNLYVGGEDGHSLVSPKDPEWEIATRFLESHHDLLTSLRTGGKLEALGLPLHSAPFNYSMEDRKALFPDEAPDDPAFFADPRDSPAYPGEEMLMGYFGPHIGSLRQAVRLLDIDTNWAIDQHDFQRAVDNVVAIFGIARQIGEHGSFIHGFTGAALQGVGIWVTSELLTEATAQLSEAQLDQIQQAVAACDVSKMFEFRGERLYLLDLLQHSYTDNGNGDGRITEQGMEYLKSLEVMLNGNKPSLIERMRGGILAAPQALWFTASRKEALKDLEEWSIRASDYLPLPFWKKPDFESFLEERKAASKRNPIVAHYFPQLEATYHIQERCLANRDGMLAAIAAIRFHKKNGVWPDSPNQLLGTYLTVEPLDRFNGQPLKFTIVDDEFRIYSIGPDGDDDIGRSILQSENGKFPKSNEPMDEFVKLNGVRNMPAIDFGFHLESHNEGDWILWPREAEIE